MELVLLWYHLALFAHLCGLLAAISASGIAHYTEVRMRKARTSGELLNLATFLGRVQMVFPLALLTLVATGAYMVSAEWTWSTGWVDAGLVGVVMLFAGGIFLGVRLAALRRALAGDPNAPVSPGALRIAHSLLTRSVSHGNTALAIGVVFIMVTKLDLLIALLSLVVAYAIGVTLAIALHRSRAADALQSQRETAAVR